MPKRALSFLFSTAGGNAAILCQDHKGAINQHVFLTKGIKHNIVRSGTTPWLKKENCVCFPETILNWLQLWRWWCLFIIRIGYQASILNITAKSKNWFQATEWKVEKSSTWGQQTILPTVHERFLHKWIKKLSVLHGPGIRPSSPGSFKLTLTRKETSTASG